MKSASVAQLKKEFNQMSQTELSEICVRLIKYKKENKELVTYILYESSHESSFISDLKLEVEELFSEINTQSLFWVKKSIRKILRHVSKNCKYSGLPTTWIEMLIHFCEQLNAMSINIHQSTAMSNLYQSQIKKIDQYISSLHEDLQYDYTSRINQLRKA